MYRCKDCGVFFEEPIVVKDDPSPRGVALTSGYYYDSHCPSCGSENLEEAEVCERCGEPIPYGAVLCDDCMDILESYIGVLEKTIGLPHDTLEDAISVMYAR